MDLTKEFKKIKTVKKATYNSVISQVHIKINLEEGPIQKEFVPRSQSFKKFTRFVPTLKPKKSTFMPTPLKLDNQISEKDEEHNDFDKQKSDDEIKIIDEDNSSFLSGSSSEVENSNNEGIKNEKVKDKEENNGIIFKKSSTNVSENKESKDMDNNIDYDPIEINDIKENEDNKSMKIFRRKMSKIKVKTGISKYKEAEETINDNFKKMFNIGMKKIEKKYESDLYSTFNCIDINKNENENPKVKSIFDIISLSKKDI